MWKTFKYEIFFFFQNNSTIFIESTIHAREWITAATATYVLNEFLTSGDPEVQALTENYDWVFIPVFNVDGYSYTHSDVSRMHTKKNYLIEIIFFFIESNVEKNSPTLQFGVLWIWSKPKFWFPSRRWA